MDSINDSNATFVFGRISTNITPSNEFYISTEIYSKTAPASLISNPNYSANSGDFWVNSNDSQSTFSIISSNNLIHSDTTSGSAINGVVKIELTNSSNSYQKGEFIIVTNPWLLDTQTSQDVTCQNFPCQIVEFFTPNNSANWSGKAQKTLTNMPNGTRKRVLN
jgi:hypothetical protein